MIAGVSFLTGVRSISSRGFDPFVKFPWSRELRAGWSVGDMQSLLRHGEWTAKRDVGTSVLPGAGGHTADAFVEYAADYPRSGDARQVIHLGAAYRFTEKQQIDFHFGFGLSHAAPTHFFAAGYAFRVKGAV